MRMPALFCLTACGFLANGFSIEQRIWDAEAFAKTSKYAKSLALEIIDSISWNGKESVLDVGTGDGKNSSLMAAKVPFGKVVGIDPSFEMLQYAQKQYPQDLFPNLSFSLGGANDYQSEERFDLIASFTVLHLVPDQQKAVEHLADLLKPGGRLYLKFPIGDGFGHALEKTIQLFDWRERFAGFNTGWHFQTKEDYIQYILLAGLIPFRIENQLLDEGYDTRSEMSDAVRCWLPHMQILNPDEQERFLKDLFDLFLKEMPPDAEGKFHYCEPTLYVHAMKPNR